MSILNIFRLLCVCVLVQGTHNNIYCMGLRDLNPLYNGASGWVLTLWLNSLPVHSYTAQSTGLCVNSDTQLIKDDFYNWPKNDNLHNHVR